jgi:hypothetical protein
VTPGRWASVFGMLITFTSCPEKFPGNEDLGQYSVQAQLKSRTCQVSEVSSEFSEFDMQLSKDSASPKAFATLRGYSRQGTFDGQIHDTRVSVQRTFATCLPCTARLEEHMVFSILSRSQSDAVGQQCPENPLDGGTPSPDTDAGITGPQTTSSGFDGVRVCGEIETNIVFEDDAGVCPDICLARCVARYELVGVRK